MKCCYVTLLSTDSYLPGVFCLYKSLRDIASKYPLMVLVSSRLSHSVIDKLRRIDVIIRNIEVIAPPKYVVNAGFENWNYTFDKLFVFSLVEYDKIVYLDSDMYIVRNIDHLFERPHMSAVNADIYNDRNGGGINSGLMVITPKIELYFLMMNVLSKQYLGDLIGDQDVIRYYYPTWNEDTSLHLPLGYNLYMPDCNRFLSTNCREQIYVLHFVGVKKPWSFSLRAWYRRYRVWNIRFLYKYMKLVLWAKYKIR